VKPHVVHIVSHPIQYFVPIYRHLAASDQLKLTVCFGSLHGTQPSYDPGIGHSVQYGNDLLSGYDYCPLPNRGSGKPDGSPSSIDSPQIDELLDLLEPDALWIHGWNYQLLRQSITWSKRNGIPYLLRGETTLLDAPRGTIRWWRRWWLYRQLFRDAAALLYVGIENRRFYESMGIRTEKMKPMFYSIDTEHFQNSRGLESQGATGPFVVVTAAKLIPRKRVKDVIEAVLRCKGNTHLWIAGDGELRSQLEDLARSARDRIRFLGFVSQSDLPELYSRAHLFALASEEETWGLVVNEAMACGLPAVVSDRCGCAVDLIENGSTGYTYPCGNVDQLSLLIQTAADCRGATTRMGVNARAHVENGYSSRESATQLIDALGQILR
jgi:glycosyltransferase involved in cell wall biosynthesis